MRLQFISLCIFSISLYISILPVLCMPFSEHNKDPRNSSNPTNQFLSDVKQGACNPQWAMKWQKGNLQTQTFAATDLVQTQNQYTLYNNVYNADYVQDGSFQTVECTQFENGVLSWKTQFSFKKSTDDTKVKSYSNIRLKPPQTIQLSALKGFSTSWKWSISDDDDLIANVAYDLFTSSNQACDNGDCAKHEIMIWLASMGKAKPIGKSTGKSVKIGEGQNGYEFEVWTGAGVHDMSVISLIPKDPMKNRYENFEADLLQLLQKELTEFGLDPQEYLILAGAGPEPFSGGGTLTTSEYTINLA